MKGIIGHLESGGIIVTYKCSAKCLHCLHNASPQRDNMFISSEQLNSILDHLVKHGCKSIHIEGGEPFLFPDKLVDAVALIQSKKIVLEHIVTNGSWYKSAQETYLLLKRLKEKGLSRLIIKFGPFQNEFITLRKVQRLLAIAEKTAINVIILGAEHFPEMASLDPSKTHSIGEYQNRFGEQYLQKVCSEFNLPLSARSFKVFGKYLNKRPLIDILKNANDCKDEFKSKYHFHIDLYGNYIFPFSKGLTLAIDDLSSSLNSVKYPFLSALQKGGINALYLLAVKQFHFEPDATYISKCHLCFHIREYLVKKCHINSPDLQPMELY